jgi:integrase
MRKLTGIFEKKIKGNVYFVARYHFPTDPVTGERRSPKDFYGKTKRQADDKRKAWVEKFEQNPRADVGSTFGAYITVEFIPSEEKRTRLPDTSKRKLSWAKYSERKSRLQKLVKSAEAKRLCATLIAELEPRHLKDYLRTVEATLSASLFNKTRQDLRLALKELQGRTRLPVSELVFCLPSPANETPKAKTLHDADDLLKKIADAQYPLEYRAIVAFEFIVQCRPQELVALTWADIDWDEETVTIDKRLAQVESKSEAKTAYAVRPGTKTGSKGVRTVYLGSLLSLMLRDLQKERMAGGVPSQYIFPYIDGTLLTKMRVRRLWAKIRATMGLEDGMTFYALKTLGNSYALSRGVTPEAQAKRMGHTTTTMATTAYRNVARSEDERAAEVFSITG